MLVIKRHHGGFTLGEFEIIGKDKDGKVREIDITPAGEVTEIE
jgi:hypothetical protein